MLPSIKNDGSTKTKVLSKREEKKGINIRSNSGLFFQMGLIVSLLLAIIVINTDFKINNDLGYQIYDDHNLDEIRMMEWRVEPVHVAKPIQPTKVIKPRPRKQITSVFQQVDDLTPTKDSSIASTELDPKTTIEPPKRMVPPVPSKGPENVLTVDLVPTFPGCEGLQDNTERLACLSSKLHAFIGRKFDTEKYSEKYAGKTNKISVQFTIDKAGNVVDIKARAPGKDLEEEAKKVIAKLPAMEPGKKNDQNVAVMYQIPIVFKSSY